MCVGEREYEYSRSEGKEIVGEKVVNLPRYRCVG